MAKVNYSYEKRQKEIAKKKKKEEKRLKKLEKKPKVQVVEPRPITTEQDAPTGSDT